MIPSKFQPSGFERFHGFDVELGGELPVRRDVVGGVLDGADAVDVLHGCALGIARYKDWLTGVDRLQASDVVHYFLMRRKGDDYNIVGN